jgi:nucleolar protein 56
MTESTNTRTEDDSADSTVTFRHPETVSIDESFTVDIENIPADTVELVVSVTDTEGIEWRARATYYVPEGPFTPTAETSMDGDIDGGVLELLQRATPVDGSERYAPDRESCDEITVRLEHDGETLGTTTIDRTFGDPDVSSRRIEDENFIGTMFEPPNAESAPAVVLLHGSGGQPSYARAQLLASHGFVALALQYFDWAGRHEMLPETLEEVPLEFVGDATEWLLGQDTVSGETVGLWGASKGGEFALLAGSHLDTVGAVVSTNGSGVVWGGLGQMGGSEKSSWTIDSQPVPQVSYTEDPSVWDRQPPMEMEPGYTQSFEEADDEEIAEATIPVEDIDGRVLLVSGGADSMWDSQRLQGLAADRLDDHSCEYEQLTYDEAGHGIAFPYVPTTHRPEGQQFEMGGTASGYATADADHWPHVIETFEALDE